MSKMTPKLKSTDIKKDPKAKAARQQGFKLKKKMLRPNPDSGSYA